MLKLTMKTLSTEEKLSTMRMLFKKAGDTTSDLRDKLDNAKRVIRGMSVVIGILVVIIIKMKS